MRYLLAALLIFIAVPAYAEPTYPLLTGRVVDNANLLSDATENELTALLETHEQKTTNQVVVVTLPTLQGYAIEEYGYQLGRHWGIGQKDKNNGVLLIVAPNERAMRIEVGYGLEGTLTDALSSKIINSFILPEFKVGNMEKGIIDGTNAIITLLGGGQIQSGLSSKEKEELYDFIAQFIAIGVFVIMVAYTLRRFGNKFGGGKGGGGSFGGGSSSGGSSFRGGGGSFGGGGSSGKW